MDIIDFQILETLSKDARTPFNKIAKKIGVSTDTICRRYNSLKEKGVIKAAMVVVDIRNCGYEGYVGLLIKAASGENQDTIHNALSSQKNVALVVKILGYYDFFVQVLIKDFTDLSKLHEEFNKIRGIVSLDLIIYSKLSNYPDSATIHSGMAGILDLENTKKPQNKETEKLATEE